MMVLSMWLIHYDHHLNAVHDFNLLFINLKHKIKRILSLSLNLKVKLKFSFIPDNGLRISRNVE